MFWHRCMAVRSLPTAASGGSAAGTAVPEKSSACDAIAQLVLWPAIEWESNQTAEGLDD